jgi:hypothetical protein
MRRCGSTACGVLLVCLALLTALAQCTATTKRRGLLFEFALEGEGVTPIGNPAKVGGGLIFDCKVTCTSRRCPDKSKTYDRYGHCTTVSVDADKGAWMACSVETYTQTGNIIMEVRVQAMQVTAVYKHVQIK